MKIRKMNAFTLAEVLITLGIIGVVAALTIPTLIANTNSQKFRAQYKKALSTLNQAALMNYAQNDWNFANLNSDCNENGTDDPTETQSICAMLNGSLAGATFLGATASAAGYTNDEITAQRYISDGAYIIYQLADGLIVGLKTPSTAGNYGIGFIDVNGKTLPNKEVRCETDADTKTVGSEGYAECTVATVTDVYPVKFYDNTVEPYTNAAKYVLTTTK